MKINLKKYNKQDKGITLIALVITIIVMLILVAVTISIAVNGGLFEYAGKAAKETNEAIDTEQELGNGKVTIGGIYYDSIDDYLNADEMKVGDYVNYTPTADSYTISGTVTGYSANQTFETGTGDSALQWRIFSINSDTGEIELISATAVHKLKLKGADGYNHGVDVLDDLCNCLYSKQLDGKTVASARSIDIDDIHEKTTYNYKTYNNTATKVSYEDVYKLSGKKYPKIYIDELGSTENGLQETAELLTESEGIRNEDGTADYLTYTGVGSASTTYVTSTFYNYDTKNYNKELGNNTAPEGLINVGTKYWLASRCVEVYSNSGYFSLRCILDTRWDVSASGLFSSNGGTGEFDHSVRPIVTLSSDVIFKKDKTKSTEDITYWDIKF